MGVYNAPITFMLDTLDKNKITRDNGHPKLVLLRTLKNAKNNGGDAKSIYNHLKLLSDFCSTNVCPCQMNSSQVFVGLHRSTPPQKWDKEKIMQDLTNWVGPGGKMWGASQKQWILDYVDTFIKQWSYREQKVAKMSFSDWCSDVIRWGTSGGSKKRQMLDQWYRTKWAYGFDSIKRGVNPYDIAKQEADVDLAHVALKEEPDKTRLVITTPMASYLRQGYMLYCMGKCKELKSPISHKYLTNNIAKKYWHQYLSIDATKFDHQIPLWFIEHVIDRIGEYSGLPQLAQEELNHFKKLYIEIFGNKIKYNGGVLSGWRMTSLFGSLASHVLCEFIKKQYPNDLVDWIVLGDDVMVMTNANISSTWQSVVSEFGLTFDINKTTCGVFGTFLRKIYGLGRVVGAAGRALRSLFYANPWVTNYQFQDPSTISASWLLFISRMQDLGNRDWLLHQAAADMARWSRTQDWTSSRWLKLLKTDSGLGGLGTIDTHSTPINDIEVLVHRGDNKKWTGDDYDKLFRYLCPEQFTRSNQFADWFKTVNIGIVDPRPITAEGYLDFSWRKNENITLACLQIVANGWRGVNDLMRKFIPHWKRNAPWYRLLDELMQKGEYLSLRRLDIPTEISAAINKPFQSQLARYVKNKRHWGPGRSAAYYLYYRLKMKNIQCCVGTW